MLRQIFIAFITATVVAPPAAAQQRIDIPGIGSIFFGGGTQHRHNDPTHIDKRFEVLDKKRNRNDESRVVFNIGRHHGRISQLRLRATGKVARITGMEVVFGNGRAQKIEIYEPIYPGQVSRAFDLTGDARVIRRVIITKRRTWQHQHGDIELLGLPDEIGDYKLLGTERDSLRQRDLEFNVGTRKGRFDSIKLRASGHPVRVSTIDVTYGNGSTQSIRYYKTLSPGYLSEPLDLKGQGRAIRRVVINKQRRWRSGDTGRGQVQLYGLPGKAPRTARFVPVATERTGRGSRDVVFDHITRENHFDEIRIKALDRRIRIKDVVVVFRNGKRQRIDINQRLRPGETTDPIALDGRSARHIDRVRVSVSRRRGRRGRLQLLGHSHDDGAAPPRPRPSAQQQIPRGWVLFGSETVGFRNERQSIHIGRDAGVFDRITFRALRNDIYIRDVTVIYGNGQRDRRKIDLLVPAGYGTPPIDLKSTRKTGRKIDEIVVTYRADVRNRRKTALLQVYGEYAEDWLRDSQRHAGHGADWVLLGARRAAMFSKDSDSIVVGKRFGRFRAVRIRSRKRDVKLYGMTITYENGTSESVPVYGKLKSGRSSRIFDLKGRKRFIRRIDIKYRTKFNFGGDGTVEIWGLR